MYKIRPESIPDQGLLNMLMDIAAGYEAKLHRNSIYPTNIFIWVKDFNGQKFPKIEFDVASEELQYDMRINGNSLEVGEVHFKTFVKQPGGKTKRVDVSRNNAHATLQAIDVILRS